MKREPWSVAAFVAALLCFSCGSGAPAAGPPPLEPSPFPIYDLLGRPDCGPMLRAVVDGPSIDGLSDSVREAASRWRDIVPLHVEIVEVDAAAIDLRISTHDATTTDCQPFLDFEGSVAHTVRTDDGLAIHLDSGADWSPSDFDLVAVLTHEFGHVFGFGHSADPTSVMYPGYDIRRSHPGRSDRAAAATLFGGGTDEAGDIEVRRGDEVVALLRGACPEGVMDWTVFDCNADRRADLVTWPVDPRELAVLKSWHFDEGGRIARTLGPRICVVDPRTGTLSAASDGEGVAVLTDEAGRYQAFLFDALGHASVPWPRGLPMRLLCGPVDADGDGRFERRDAVRVTRGDIDGDGVLEEFRLRGR